MNKTWWDYLIDPNTEMLGLKTDRVNMKGWINEIIQHINNIEDDQEAVKALFVISQKIGYVKGKHDAYRYPPELYERLETTVNILLKKRMEKPQQETAEYKERAIKEYKRVCGVKNEKAFALERLTTEMQGVTDRLSHMADILQRKQDNGELLTVQGDLLKEIVEEMRELLSN